MLFCSFPLSSLAEPIRIIQRTDNFLDIEVETKHLHMDTSGTDDTCIFAHDIFDGKERYLFIYRRPYNFKMCKDEKNEYLKLLKDAKKFRIVGVGNFISEIEPLPKYFVKSKEDIKKKVNTVSLMFTRLQVGPKCKAYFSTDCDLPQNYWAGTIPPEKK